MSSFHDTLLCTAPLFIPSLHFHLTHLIAFQSIVSNSIFNIINYAFLHIFPLQNIPFLIFNYLFKAPYTYLKSVSLNCLANTLNIKIISLSFAVPWHTQLPLPAYRSAAAASYSCLPTLTAHAQSPDCTFHLRCTLRL